MSIDDQVQEFLTIVDKVLNVYNQAVITFDDGRQWDCIRFDGGEFRFGLSDKQDVAFREKLHSRIVSASFAFIISVVTTEVYNDQPFVKKYGFIFEDFEYKNSTAQDLLEKYKKHFGLDEHSVFCDLTGERILC